MDELLDTIIDKSIANTTYICESMVGALESDDIWRVMRITEVNGVKTIRYAGNGGFNQIAANRTALSYGG